MIRLAFPFSNHAFLTILLTASILFLQLPIHASAKPQPKDNAKMECLPTDEDMTSFTCLNARDSIECINVHPECEEWAKKGECKNNPQYMLLSCRKACQSCITLHHGGITQLAAQHPRHVIQELVESQHYLHKLANDSGVKHLKSCINKHEMCTEWAVLGECESNSGFMQTECRLACRTCE